MTAENVQGALQIKPTLLSSYAQIDSAKISLAWLEPLIEEQQRYITPNLTPTDGFVVNAQSGHDALAIVDAVEGTPPTIVARYKDDIAAK